MSAPFSKVTLICLACHKPTKTPVLHMMFRHARVLKSDTDVLKHFFIIPWSQTK